MAAYSTAELQSNEEKNDGPLQELYTQSDDIDQRFIRVENNTETTG